MNFARYIFFYLAFFWSIASIGQNAVDLIYQAKKIQNIDPDSAYKLVEKAYAIIRETKDQQLKAEIHLQFGDLLYQQGAFTKALDYYLEARLIFENSNNDSGIANSLLHLGKVKYYLKQEEEALNDLKESYEMYTTLGSKKKQAETLGEIGHMFEKKEVLDSAQYYQLRAFEIYKSLNDSAGLAHIMENLGSILEDKEEYENAFEYFKQAYQYNRNLNQQVAMVGNLNNIGDYFRKTSRYDSALHYTNQALVLASSLDLDYKESSALRDLGKIYESMGEYEKALHYKELARELYESIYSRESSQQLALLEILYDLEQKNAEIKALESQKRADSSIKWAALATSGMLLIMVIVIINRQRFKMKKNQEIIRQNELLHKQELENVRLSEEHLKMELKHKQLQEEHLNLEIETQQRSLGARMLQLIEKNKLLEEIRTGMSDLNGVLPEAMQNKVNHVVRGIDHSFNHDKEWEEFRKSFEMIHKEFFDHLKQINPQLTSNDLRICALIKINLQSKEIAELLSISNDSLRVARYRLRKKLKLKRGDGLRKFLLNI